MSSSPPAERGNVQIPAQRRTRRSPGNRPRGSEKRAASSRAPREPAPVIPVSAAIPAPLATILFAVAIASALLVYLLVGRDADAWAPVTSAAPTVISATALARFARGNASPVYWAGEQDARTLELTSTPSATFVRYRPLSSSGGRSLTIATYPLADAYGTAVGRSRSDAMTSRRTKDGGIAVWSRELPTSVYLAWRGVPSLVEVYAPTASEARTVALSGHVRAAR